MSRGCELRLILITALMAVVLLSCTAAPTTPPPAPAAKDSAAAKPSPSPSPLAQATPTTPLRPIVGGGGAAQPRATTATGGIGGSAILIVPTPNFAQNPTAAPAALPPTVAIATNQPAQVVNVTGTLSRIPTAIPAPPLSVAGAAAGTAVAGAGVTGAGGGLGISVIQAVLTATPLTRITPQPQATIFIPGGRGSGN
ncbi:MAG: hypothetical protein U0893_18915 [Chloroflexota bacterium]